MFKGHFILIFKEGSALGLFELSVTSYAHFVTSFDFGTFVLS